MGAWEGIWLGMQAVDEARYRDEQLNLQKDQEERLRKAEEAKSQLKKVQTLMKMSKDIFPSSNQRSTKLSIKGDLVKDLKNYFNDDFLTPILATNNPEIQSSLLKAVRETQNKLVEGGASATNINKKRLSELYSGINIMPGQNQNLMLENIMARSVQLGISPETWVQYPEIYAKIQRQVEQASLPTANIHTMSITPSLSGTEIEKSMDLIMRNHNEDFDIIKSNLNVLNNQTDLPTNFTQWVTKYASFVNNIGEGTEAKKLAFTGIVNPDNLYNMFEGRADISENPYINEIIKKAEQLKKSDVMEIDLVGDKESGAGTSYIYWGDPAKEAIYQDQDGFWEIGENNPYALTRKYFNDTGVKLIPEGSLIKVMLRKTITQGASSAPMYKYVPTRTTMEYK